MRNINQYFAFLSDQQLTGNEKDIAGPDLQYLTYLRDRMVLSGMSYCCISFLLIFTWYFMHRLRWIYWGRYILKTSSDKLFFLTEFETTIWPSLLFGLKVNVLLKPLYILPSWKDDSILQIREQKECEYIKVFSQTRWSKQI